MNAMSEIPYRILTEAPVPGTNLGYDPSLRLRANPSFAHLSMKSEKKTRDNDESRFRRVSQALCSSGACFFRKARAHSWACSAC